MKRTRHDKLNLKTVYPIRSRPSGAKNVDKLTAPVASAQRTHQRDLAADTALVTGRAFAQGKAEKELLARFHQLGEVISTSPKETQIWRVYDWLLVPYSLWPIDLVGVAKHLLGRIEAKRAIDEDCIALIDTLAEPPGKDARDTMTKFERQIAAGSYDNLVKQLEKFSELEARLGEEAEAKLAWKNICSRFDVAKYRNVRGIIRRRFSSERNFRDLRFKWTTKKERFRTVFDAFCHRWNLYGVEHDKLLIMKITVNPTPHGTMLFIPKFWSFDPHRDLAWGEISRLHKAHGAARQGPKLSLSRQEKQLEKIKARQLEANARTKGLRGDAKNAFILKGLRKDPRTDFSYIKRLLA